MFWMESDFWQKAHHHQNTVHQILDETDQEEILLLIKASLSEHTKSRSQAFFNKIPDDCSKVCFAYTHCYFTACHVAGQRDETLSGVIKICSMKKLLVESTFPEHINGWRLLQGTPIWPTVKILSCSVARANISERGMLVLLKAKSKAIKLSFVEAHALQKT